MYIILSSYVYKFILLCIKNILLRIKNKKLSKNLQVSFSSLLNKLNFENFRFVEGTNVGGRDDFGAIKPLDEMK